MKTQCRLYITRSGAVRVTKGRGSAKAGEVEVSLTLHVPDALFQRAVMAAEIHLPEPSELPDIQVSVADAALIARSIQADVDEILYDAISESDGDDTE